MRKILIAVVCIYAVQTASWATQATPPAFKHSVNAGLTLTDGNSETLRANASVLTEGEKEGLGSIRAGVEANYGESTVSSHKDTTVDNARVFLGAKKTLSSRTFVSLNAEVLYDNLANIDYRATIGPALGVYGIKNDSTSLSLEAGPSYLWEKVAGVKDDYLTVRFAERWDYAFSKTAKVWQAVEYLPRIDDFGDYLMSAEFGAEAALNARLSLRLLLQDKYDSTPGVGLKKNDISLIGGIGLTL